MTGTDFNIRASKGQAMNLAVQQAIHEDKANDTKHIYSLFIKYYEIGQLLQSASIDDLKEALK